MKSVSFKEPLIDNNRVNDGKLLLLQGITNKTKQLLKTNQIENSKLVNDLIDKDNNIVILENNINNLKSSIRKNEGHNTLLQYQLNKAKNENNLLLNKQLNILQANQLTINPLNDLQDRLIHWHKSQLVLSQLISKLNNEKFVITKELTNHPTVKQCNETSNDSIIQLNNNLVNKTNEMFCNEEGVSIDNQNRDNKLSIQDQLLYQIRLNERLKAQLHTWVDKQIVIHENLAHNEILNKSNNYPDYETIDSNINNNIFSSPSISKSINQINIYKYSEVKSTIKSLCQIDMNINMNTNYSTAVSRKIDEKSSPNIIKQLFNKLNENTNSNIIDSKIDNKLDSKIDSKIDKKLDSNFDNKLSSTTIHNMENDHINILSPNSFSIHMNRIRSENHKIRDNIEKFQRTLKDIKNRNDSTYNYTRANYL